ncbi:hypothetical protein SBOR_6197 [Sclerotinia borealis F-4128]|uniref:FAD-binding PCMH-type domain-containing protein n=1 Tax=Sclerotinia borealis (strain F-4128) TaxID=1432307 RepID=W9C9J3_SCLBF|nr:hypothetical protein SBOR_6197 [Sclerotinia borealis F-4128]
MLSFISVITVLVILPLGNASSSTNNYPSLPSHGPKCRYLPSDPAWPNQTVWNNLNQTVEGRLIRGVPLGQPCYEPHLDVTKCSQIREEWIMLSPFNAEDVMAGLRFVHDNNIRLTIKNTGHDFLGRSTGAGSLALWMHNLDETIFLNYSSTLYTGPAVHIGAGVRYSDLHPVARKHGYRVVSGSCSTVGLTGGFTQGGGHGPLASAYGLGADQVLEWEVVTAAGEHLTVSPVHYADLYWALSGGGAGNFAVVLSMKVRVYPEGPVAGAAFSFVDNGNSTAYWAAINDWLQTLLVLDTIDGLTTVSAITAEGFSLESATLPDVTTTDKIDNALASFFSKLADLNISLAKNYTANIHTSFADYYEFSILQAYTSNITIGGRNIPRSTVQDTSTALPAIISAFRGITHTGGTIFLTAANILHANYTRNSVLPSWRNALFSAAFSSPLAANASREEIRDNQALLNRWQEELRALTPGAGAYMNEATWDNVEWKEDYFGGNYEELLRVKRRYDSGNLFWAVAAVGSDDSWGVGNGGALCRV